MKVVPKASSASILRGFWFVFGGSDLDLALWLSTISGKEELYVNGHQVSQSREMALSSSHVHREGNTTYEVVVKATSVRRAEVECSLSRDGVLQEIVRSKLVQPRLWLRLAVIASIGVSMFFAARSGMSLWLALGVLVPTVFMLYRLAGVGYIFTSSREPHRASKGASDA